MVVVQNTALLINIQKQDKAVKGKNIQEVQNSLSLDLLYRFAFLFDFIHNLLQPNQQRIHKTLWHKSHLQLSSAIFSVLSWSFTMAWCFQLTINLETTIRSVVQKDFNFGWLKRRIPLEINYLQFCTGFFKDSVNERLRTSCILCQI